MFFNLKKLFIGLMIGFGMFTTHASAVQYNSTSCNNGQTTLYLNGTISDDVYIESCPVVIQDGTTINGNLQIISGSVTVQDGATVNIRDNVLTDAYQMQLGNSTVNIGGYLKQGAGTLYSDTVTLNIEGDYNVTGGVLYMQNDSAHVKVNGNFNFSTGSSGSYLTAGTLEVKGDFNHISTVADSFNAQVTHKVLLSGSGSQSVTLNHEPTSYTGSNFNILEVNNTSVEGVTFADNGIKIKDTLITTTSNLHNLRLVNSNNITLKNDVTIDGDVDFVNSSIQLGSNHTVSISGDVKLVVGTLVLDSSTLNIGGDLNQTIYSVIDTKIGTLHVQGNYDKAGSSGLRMTNEGGHIIVDGNLTLLDGDGSLTAGTLEAKGDFTVNSYLRPSGTHKVLLSGNGPQTVNLNSASPGSDSYFNGLEVNNTSTEGVTFASVISIRSNLAATATSKLHNLHLVYSNFMITSDITIDGGLEVAGGTMYLGSGHTVTINGDVNLSAYAFDLNSSTLNIGGDLNQTYGTIHANTGRLNVGGDLYQTMSSWSNTLIYTDSGTLNVQGNLNQAGGYIYTNLGTINIGGDLNQSNNYYGSYITADSGTLNLQGNLNQTSGKINLNTGTFNIGGNLYQNGNTLSAGGGYWSGANIYTDSGTLNVQGNCDISATSRLDMTNDSAYVRVDGNFTMAGTDSGYSSLTAGTLEVKGDFSQIYDPSKYYSMYNFKSSGTHKVILSGDSTQTVNFGYTGDYGSAFNILEVANPSAEGVIFATAVTVRDSITANSCTVPLVLDNVTYGTLSLEGTCTELSLNTVNKTKYFLDSTGDIGVRTYADDYTYTGTITLSDGTVVDVSGMYEIVDDTLTLTRESPAPAVLVFTYLGKDAGVMNFNGSVDGGTQFQSKVYDTKEERDAAMPKKVNPAVIMYLLN